MDEAIRTNSVIAIADDDDEPATITPPTGKRPRSPRASEAPTAPYGHLASAPPPPPGVARVVARVAGGGAIPGGGGGGGGSPAPPAAAAARPGGDGDEHPTDERTRKRRAVEHYVSALEHATACDGRGCARLSCEKMRGYLDHARTCTAPHGTCLNCRRVSTLVYLHARECRATECGVPGCRARREQMLVDQWRSVLEG